MAVLESKTAEGAAVVRSEFEQQNKSSVLLLSCFIQYIAIKNWYVKGPLLLYPQD